MGFRFHKSFKVAPGIKLNLSRSGFGVSAGIRGARIGVNSRGAYRSFGIPGTGISSISYSKKSLNKPSVLHSKDKSKNSIGSGVLFFWIVGIVFGIAIPQLGAFLLFAVIFYYFQRNKSPVHKASQKNKKAISLMNEKSFDEAEVLFLESKKLDPENNQTDFLLGALYHNQGKYSEAIPYLLDAKKYDNENIDIAISLANSYFNTERYDDVIIVIQSLVGGWENNLKAIQLLGMSFSNLKKFDLAIDVFKKAPLLKRNLDSDLLELHYNMASVYDLAGDTRNALKHFKRVYACDINYKNVMGRMLELEDRR